MKKIIICALLISLQACAQKRKKTTSTIKQLSEMKAEDVNSENIVDYISSKVKIYKKNPMYVIRPVQNSCVYEILVNDYPIDQNYSLRKLATPIEINRAILKSGPQTITYRLYPLGDLMVDTYGKGETITTLLKNTTMNIEVIKYEDVKTGTGIDDEIVVTQHTSATKKDSKEFIGAGLPYYEYTFTFNAKVPYKNKGWSNGQDLTKFDKKELEAAVVKKCEYLKKLYLEKNIEKLIQVEYLQSMGEDIATYKEKNKVKSYWEQYLEFVNLEDKDFQPLEGYEMYFFGKGKIVALRHSSIAPPDPRLRGESALYFLYNVGDGIRALFKGAFLYLPEGEPLENLQML